jgi:hypothetical protein
MDNVRVIPTRAGMRLRHQPSGIELADEGGLWPNDSFTARRLVDQDITRAQEQSAAAQSVSDKTVPGNVDKVSAGTEGDQPARQTSASAESVAQDTPSIGQPEHHNRKTR